MQQNKRYYEGKYRNGEHIARIPVPVTKQLIKRGQERYNIYCAVCHSESGLGNGPVVQRGYPPAPDVTLRTYVAMSDGYLYDVVSNGVRNMPGYAHSLEPNDRWAIVAYVRALQLAQNATIDDVPVQLRKNIQ